MVLGSGGEDVSKQILPAHMCCDYATHRIFEREKRGQVRIALIATEVLGVGCAYTPAHEEIAKAREWLLKAKEKLSVKAWRATRDTGEKS